MQVPVRSARVSIVIPLQRNEKRFEATLLSVLENQPEDCQIIAVHNGTYSDPFDLGDELQFVTARSSNLVDSIRDAFEATTAPLVHVIGTGIEATAGWLDDTLLRFDQKNLAAVAPELIGTDGVRLGPSTWSDTEGRFCQREWEGRGKTGGSKLSGFFLSTFTIRRRLLGDLLEAVAPAMNDPIAVGYAFGCLLSRAGWQIQVDSESGVIARETMDFDESDSARGQCLTAIRRRVLPAAAPPRLGAMLGAALFGSSSLAEMLGMMRYRGGLAAMRRAIDPESVSTADELARVLDLETGPSALKRAA